jgi:AbrB family looped-hinge helix DNA binding protein
MSETTRITEKGQATIPKVFREKYGLEAGDEVVWVDSEAGIVVKKRTRTDARGLLVPEDTPSEKREAVGTELSQRLRERRQHNYEDPERGT